MTIEDVLDYINYKTDVFIRLYTEHTQPYIEIEYYSALGEDVVQTIWFEEETGEALLNALNDSLADYDDICEDSLELYIKERPRGTENFKVRQLVDDADWKVKFWKEFVEDLNNHFER